MEKYYKILRNGKSCHGGDHTWEQGVTYEVEEVIPCVSGFHACRLQDLIYWFVHDMEIWEIELGEIVAATDKVVGRTARLTKRLGSFTMKKQVEFARWCASTATIAAEAAATRAADGGAACANAAARDAANAAARAAAVWADRAAAWAAGDNAAQVAAAVRDAAARVANAAADAAIAAASTAVDAADAVADWSTVHANMRLAQGRKILELLSSSAPV